MFDLDGTLLDTEALYLTAAQRVCASYGATYTLALKRRLMGGDSLVGAEIVTTELGLPLSAAEYLKERERLLSELWPVARAMAGATELISQLRAHDVPFAIATSGHRHVTTQKLAHHRFLADVDVVLCGDDRRVRRGKPAPDIFLAAAAALGVAPDGCIAVEDSPTGVQAATGAGMHTIALIDPRWGHAEDAFAAAHRRVASLRELSVDALAFGR